MAGGDQTVSVSTPARPSQGGRLIQLIALAVFLVFIVVGSETVKPAKAASSVAIGVAVPHLPWELTDLDAFENATGKQNAIVNCFWSWDDSNYTPDTTLFARIADRGSIPMLTWMPQDYRLGMNQPAFSLSQILSGRYDAFITNWATALAAYKRPILIRFAHEMNGNWYPWSAGINGNTAAQYVAVWRKVHDIFVAHHATNVMWVWSPNVENSDPAAFYPGDAYVDIAAMDGYNNIAWGSWRSFTQIFGPSYRRLSEITQKPKMVAEVGTSEGAGAQDKANWIRSMYRTELPQSFPAVIAVVWFSVDMRALEANSADWRVDSSAPSLTAYRDEIAQYSGGGVSSVPPALVSANITSPTIGSNLGGSSQLFTWTAANNATGYAVYAGSAPGAYNYFSSLYNATSGTATGLPTNGSTVYIRLWTNFSGTWQFNDYTYTAASSGGVGGAAVMTSPATGSNLGGASQLFTWGTAAGATQYAVYAGSAPGAYNYFSSLYNATSGTVTGLPTNGSKVYIRLWTNFSGTWQFNDYTYTAP
jgi:hypothetical protein